MRVIVVDYPWRKTFVLTAFVKVCQTSFKLLKETDPIITFSIVFRCKVDADCSGNGYCHVGICICSPNYEYALDCSHYGCKYIIS